MNLLNKIKQTKKNTIFLIIGLFLTILFFLLVFINHFNQMKVKSIYKTLENTSNYQIVLNSEKSKEKIKLFDYRNYHFYGYGITRVNLSYDGTTWNLKNVLKNKFLTLEDILDQFDLISEINQLKIYKNENYLITVEFFSDKNIEVIFSKR